MVEPLKGVPVKAIKAYDAKTPNELSIRVGEPLTYMGSSPNGWSKVSNHVGVVGYVPHRTLSQ